MSLSNAGRPDLLYNFDNLGHNRQEVMVFNESDQLNNTYLSKNYHEVKEF